MSPSMEAAAYGLLSAVSLPLGAALGLWLRPGPRWTSSLMAFGGGALLAALTLELAHEALLKAGFAPVAAGFATGALLFMALNRLLNSFGGFLRKVSTTTRHLLTLKRRRAERRLARLSRVRFVAELPPAEMQAILRYVVEVRFRRGQTVFREGDPGDRMYLIEHGSVEVLRMGSGGDAPLAVLGEGEVFGEMALLTGSPRNATVVARTDVLAASFAREDFARLLDASPSLKAAVEEAARRRAGENAARPAEDEAHAEEWFERARAHLGRESLGVGPIDVRRAHAQHAGGAAMAIWLGILLDGIPESLVIGGTMSGGGAVSMTLIAGVFLANFPEALSSAVGMRRQGTGVARVMWMWTSLMLLTGLGAWVGYYTGAQMPPRVAAFIETTAAGAMLAMIAETMLPEATEQGGPATGLMTVLGFLAAIFVSHAEHG